jgi:hypothetical protein
MQNSDSFQRLFRIIAFVLLCGSFVVAAYAEDTSKGLQKDAATGSATFVFVNDRPDDHLLELTGEVPETLNKGLRVRVTESVGSKWLLPVYVVKDVQLPTADRPEVKVTLSDALYDDPLDRGSSSAVRVSPGTTRSSRCSTPSRTV